MNTLKHRAVLGEKEVVRNKKAVCSSSHPLVTHTMLEVMKKGGNAVDAAVTGALLQPILEPHMTNHAGTVSVLYWDNKSKKAFQLNGSGTLVPGLSPFRPFPPIGVRFASTNHTPMACIPGFIPALGIFHERFGSMNWEDMCEPAISSAEYGHEVSAFEYSTLTEELGFLTYFPCSRDLFTPNGFLPEPGSRFVNKNLAKTLKGLAKEGSDYFTLGEWGRDFVKKANTLGWPIDVNHMVENPPRWQEPLSYIYNDHQIIQLSPPERTGLFTALCLGILNQINIKKSGHYSENADALYYFAHVLRRVHHEMGYINDPQIFESPEKIFLSEEYQKLTAKIIEQSKPTVDLTDHVRLSSGYPSMLAAGYPYSQADAGHQSAGSCELSVVDSDGNWVQLMNTLQSGGIPGVVVGGVHMVGTHARTNLDADIAGWIAENSRLKLIIGSTFVCKNGEPILSLGSPGNVYATVPQVLSSILDYGMNPYEASVKPRMDPLRDDYVLEIESRIPSTVIKDLIKFGVQIKPLPKYDYNMGSFQICWREEKSGLLGSSSDPRRTGIAGGI